jgi:2-haloacid dehalogenase
LSNGNLSMLTGLFAAAGLTWHCVLSGEMVHAYKPDPAVYRLVAHRQQEPDVHAKCGKTGRSGSRREA